MHPDLSFEQAPPISVPYRFFLTAPLFGLVAGLLLAWFGESAMASRWTNGALALTHLLAVGFMLQAMTGAILQFVPVAAGGNVWRPTLVANIVHPALIVGAIALVTAFLAQESTLFRLAAGIFLATLAFFVIVVGIALVRTPARGATLLSLRTAVVGLGATAVLGATLAEGLAAGDRSWPLVEIANVHAGWGLGGWALLLLAGVSYYVVPMFQLTPGYPVPFARWLPPAVIAVLLAWSWQLNGRSPAWEHLVWLTGLALGAGYAGVTLWLQSRRRRRVPDSTLLFFRGAMLCLIGLLVSALVMSAFPALAEHPRAAYWLGVLALPGTFVSAINGMLYKIVPFLNWLHLQRMMGLGTLPPNMKEMIPERVIVLQMRVHFASVILLLVGALVPQLSRLAGVVFAVSSILLARNIVRAMQFYRDFRDRTRAAAPDPARQSAGHAPR